MEQSYILVLGSNVGERRYYLQQATEQLGRELQIVQQTEVLETAPLLAPNQGHFLNQALLVRTGLAPAELLQLVKKTELLLGRQKRQRYGPREIDIDIVWWSGGAYQQANLVIPHPHNNARFWVRHFISVLNKTEIMETRPVHQIGDFRRKKENGEKISVLTCYDFTFARLLARSSVDTVLVGDSLGNVVQGLDHTLQVTVDDIIYHCRAVRRALPDLFITADMPFLSYQVSDEEAVANAGRIIREGGANAVKIEGGQAFVSTVEKLKRASIPVMGHLGLTPQSVHQLGGYRLQAREKTAQKQLLADALALQKAGAFALVLELVPAGIARQISQKLDIPAIGIGAGAGCDGQVLVLPDMLGLNPDFQPRFVRNYGQLSQQVLAAVEDYCRDVRAGSFPNESESF